MNRCRVYSALCVHWDHHPSDASQHYGEGTNADEIRRYLRAVKPDATQYHTIGCFGYASFPSRIAPVVPGLVGDPLNTWARTDEEEGVAFGCYAAAFDCRFPSPVPQWRCISRAGVVSDHEYCPNGPWTEDFFIPFLLEVTTRYHPAHFWLDGTWISHKHEDFCFCTHCQARYSGQYGHAMPIEPTKSQWAELLDFHEKSLDNAIGRIARAIKAYEPAITLACNHMYYFHDARKPVADVDWLSWDALNTPDLHCASFESNYLTTAGKPSDVMIYEQGIVHWQPTLLRRPRTTSQILTEISTVLAHGNRVNLWHDPEPNGAIAAQKVLLGSAVANFVRQRQDWCIGNESVAEIAVLVSRLDHCSDAKRQGVTVRVLQQLLQESHIPCDLVRDDTLLSRLMQYHLIILPETSALLLDTAQWLHQYVEDGGNVLYVATQDSAPETRWLETILGLNQGDTITPSLRAGGVVVHDNDHITTDHHRYTLSGAWQSCYAYTDDVPWLGKLHVGHGAVFVIAGEALTEYAKTFWSPLRNLIAAAIREGISDLPLVEMESHPGIELVVNRRGSDLYLHLVNLTPDTALSGVFYGDVATYRDIEVIIRPPHAPTSVVLLPDNIILTSTAQLSESKDSPDHSTVRVVVPELHYHCAIRLENAASE